MLTKEQMVKVINNQFLEYKVEKKHVEFSKNNAIEYLKNTPIEEAAEFLSNHVTCLRQIGIIVDHE